MKQPIQITSCCITDKGKVRSHNEDTCLANNESGYFLVADGMGGAAAGEVASSLFKETVVELFSRNRNLSPEEIHELVRICFERANTTILTHIADNPSHSGMGCTAELIAFHDSKYILGHVGDSRTYCLSCGQLKQLTKDHTFVQEQKDLGLITEEQARTHTMRHIILRVVGSADGVEPDLIHGAALPGDIFLLCSDGLTGMIDDDQIKEVLMFDGSLEIKAKILIDQANHAGGKDNITVSLIEFQKQ